MTKKIFVNGTFDIVHCGHLTLLNYAKSLGDYLLVAIDSDERVKELKGEDRPINSVYARKTLLKNLKMVDEVASFASNEQLCSIIKQYSPDVMVVGSDYKNKTVVGSEYSKQLHFFDRLPEYSTTALIERISENRL